MCLKMLLSGSSISEDWQRTERILLIDDELPIVQLNRRDLEKLGYQATARSSSIEAFELFKAKPGDFDIVVTDMTVPNMNGDKLAVELIRIRPDIPIDYAKKDHVVMFCNGYGDVLRKPFVVKNSPEGVGYLLKQATHSCRHRGIKSEHAFFGGEDVGSYAENFVHTLRSGGWLVAGVNARDAKKQRSNIQASIDQVDLIGVASLLINRRANCSPAQSGIGRHPP